MAKNKVVAGDYMGYSVKVNWGAVTFNPPFLSGNNSVIPINNTTVWGYELIASEYHRSVASSLIRGLIGKYFLGAVGMLSGISSARDSGIYTVSVTFHDGRRSLIEVGNKQYKALIRSAY